MHGKHCEDAQQKWHMLAEPKHAPDTETDPDRLNCFYQGGRKIAIGDTALFRAGNALPFIGIIKKFTAQKEGAPKLLVNWLYRPADIELAKGALVDSAPNEVFYSFHKDEIPAASLLHPCKVAFLPKGVDLPSGVSALVCRRVYDTSTKCLYWLTDQDYADEHQGEVDRLLNKTKHEMQAAAGQTERPSQRASGEVKPEPLSSFQAKSKKRERMDQSSESVKRERQAKEEDIDPKREPTMKFEDFISIAEKDKGLTSLFVVDHFLQVMALERIDGSKSLADIVSHRIKLVEIIAATEKEDCLNKFVRLGGLPILDDWLQEAQKGKLGNGHHKENDRTGDELLLSLLRALEKLPVDLDALKTCYVGKSVNFLKGHRNPEVQRKARKIVDFWKKRVHAEMNLRDEAKAGLNNTTACSSQANADLLTSKHGSKSNASAQLNRNGSSPNGEEASGSGCKEAVELSSLRNISSKSHVNVASEVVTTLKEEKSCSSSYSQNNSHSWCSASAGKAGGSLKEEGKVPAVLSAGNKSAVTTLRSHSKGHNPIVTSTVSQRDSMGKHKTSGLEKVTSSIISDKKAAEVVNHGNQRLIVRLPNPGRTPTHSTSLVDGGMSNNKGLSVCTTDRQDSLNVNNMLTDAHSPDTSGSAKGGNIGFKGGRNGVDAGEDIKRSAIMSLDDIDHKGSDVKHRFRSFAVNKCSSATHMSTSKRVNHSSAMNITPVSSISNPPAGLTIGTGEDGIELLASIAACEDSVAEKCFSESAEGERLSQIAEVNPNSTSQEQVLDLQGDGNIEASPDGKKSNKEEGLHESELPSTCGRVTETAEGNADDREMCRSPLHAKEDVDVAEAIIESGSKDEKASAVTAEDSPMSPDVNTSARVAANDPGAAQCECDSKMQNSRFHTEECEVSTPSGLDNVAAMQEVSENGSKDLPSPTVFPKVSSVSPNTGDVISEYDVEDALEVARLVAKEVEQEVQMYGQHESQEVCSSSPDKKDVSQDDAHESLSCKNASSFDVQDLCTKDASEGKLISDDALHDKGDVEESRKDVSSDVVLSAKSEILELPSDSVKDEVKAHSHYNDVSNAEVNIHTSLTAAAEIVSHSLPIEVSTSDGEPVLPNDKSRDVVERPIFDLNEGLVTEEGVQEHVTLPVVPTSSPSAPVTDSTGLTGNSSSLPAPIAVVSATKGSFMPPSNALRSNVELGWKGSAATSAFRPAEPRRMLEASQTASDIVLQKGNLAMKDEVERYSHKLDIDLNVADDLMEEANVSSAGDHDISNGPAATRPEFDLNRIDDSDESNMVFESNSRLPSTATRTVLDFDLNDGLGGEETGVEVSSHTKNAEISITSISGGTRPVAEAVNVIPWYNSASSIPAPPVVVPAFPTHRPDLQYSVGAVSGSKPLNSSNQSFGQFGGVSYQGPAAISSANIPYIGTTFPHASYSFGGFPFPATPYSLSSGSNVIMNNTLPFPSVSPSQLVSAGAVIAPFGRPYLGGCFGSIAGSDSTVTWSRPSLDLNADVITDLDSKDEGYATRSNIGQLHHQQTGALSGAMKRKEPESGYDPFISNFKQMAWRE
ncbi:hypothetical protein KP509_24G078000 [Ceratopteris richardii]|uniref:Uncharacterized protein n=1 Tax=Ceratopteris richardii TaxID=49495 RepID=A0A8T2RWA9_CERRI|nr:hypothetical protein KP509_24G078000 [Ceratopteris richardii]